MILQSSRILLRPLEAGDERALLSFGRHASPLMRDYNFYYFTELDLKLWAVSKKKTMKQSYFAICLKEGPMIGFLGMKNIRLFKKEATLGLVINADHMGLGYGSEVLSAFLPYYFEVLDMKSMHLLVNGFNRRAIALYEKAGFVRREEYWEEVLEVVDPSDPLFQETKEEFMWSKDRWYQRILRMSLSRESYGGGFYAISD